MKIYIIYFQLRIIYRFFIISKQSNFHSKSRFDTSKKLLIGRKIKFLITILLAEVLQI